MAGDHKPNVCARTKSRAEHESHLNGISAVILFFSDTLKGLGPVALNTSSGLCAFCFALTLWEAVLGRSLPVLRCGAGPAALPHTSYQVPGALDAPGCGSQQNTPSSCSQTL